jgi:glutamate carboxypeptidase
MSREWLAAFAAAEGRLLSALEELVRLESPSEDAEAVSGLAAHVESRLAAAAVASRRLPCPPAGDALLATLGGGDGGTLLLGHLDTVWPTGSFGAPWRREGDRACGPGVFDMKAGIAVAMSVLGLLASRPASPRVSLLLVPDEETGSLASRALTVDVARRHRRVLVLEPSHEGAAKVARKGCGTFRARFHGRSAHAGLEPERGASALAEMSRFVLFAEGLGDGRGTTVVPSVARAGTASNVVPERAEVTVDARAWSTADAGRVEQALRAYRPGHPRVSIEITGGFDRPPLEPTAASQKIYEAARRIAEEIGFELGAARVGGASDGNFTAAAGVPTLDGLGPRGGGAHARDEHVLVSDLPRRAALLATLLTAEP